MKEIKVSNVLEGSIAEEVGVEAGDFLLAINGEGIYDIFDYRFLSTAEELTIEIKKPDGEVWEIEIEKDEYEDLGMEFENPMIEDATSCTNNCVFCFIDQLPKGMRNTLYFKDDDSRLSFLTGNYVTLTNMKDADIDRIIKYKMSPINISVHTTNPQLRIKMLGNRFAGDVMDKIKKLANAGIVLNCQIVLCRDINDGEELDRTIEDLCALYPAVYSISIVPVGITRYRKELPLLKPFDKVSSQKTIKQVEAWQNNFMKKYSSTIVYLADEFYIMAEAEIPEYSHYEDFPQIENGVGLIAMLREEFWEYLKVSGNTFKNQANKRTISIATGVSAAPYLRLLVKQLEVLNLDIKVQIFEIKNEFFGENVTVTGLLTGRDIVSQLKGIALGEELLLCKVMLKSGEDLFLDDYTVKMVEQELDTKVTIVENSGSDFIKAILNTMEVQ